MESTQKPVTANRLSVLWTFVIGIFGFAIFLGLTLLLVNIFTPTDDYEDTRGQERLEKRLEIDGTADTTNDSYAWINQDQGVVRIPVSRAAELIVDELNAKSVQATTVPVPGTPTAEAALQAITAGSAEAATAQPAEVVTSQESALDSEQEAGPLASEEASSALFGGPETESPSTVINTAPAAENLEEAPREATP